MALTEPVCYGTVGLTYRKDQKRSSIFKQFTELAGQFFKELKQDARIASQLWD